MATTTAGSSGVGSLGGPTGAGSAVQPPAAGLVAFERFGGACAIAAGVTGFLYAVSFVVLRSEGLSALFLLLGGLLATAVYVALHERFRWADAPLALWATLLGVAAGLGSAAHAGYDLANAINPPASLPDIPSPVDPRGLMTFGVAGLAAGIASRLAVRTRTLPAGVGYLGYALAALLVAIYLARLIILDATNPVIVVLVLVTGFVVNPVWYVWLGMSLWRKPKP